MSMGQTMMDMKTRKHIKSGKARTLMVTGCKERDTGAGSKGMEARSK
jgi:hypothetical protein